MTSSPIFSNLEIVMKDGHYKKEGVPDKIHTKVLRIMDKLNKEGITDEDVVQVLVNFGLIDYVCTVRERHD